MLVRLIPLDYVPLQTLPRLRPFELPSQQKELKRTYWYGKGTAQKEKCKRYNYYSSTELGKE